MRPSPTGPSSTCGAAGRPALAPPAAAALPVAATPALSAVRAVTPIDATVLLRGRVAVTVAVVVSGPGRRPAAGT